MDPRRPHALTDVSGAHTAIEALGIKEIDTGYEGRFFIGLAAGFQCCRGLGLQRQDGFIDFLAPPPGMGEEYGYAIAQTIGGDDLALL